MAERGRPSASSGNAYHDIRVTHCLIDLLEDASFTSVAVETLDATDDLVVRRSDEPLRYEQVKERAPGASWTALRLIDEGILDQFIRQYRADPNGELVLYTGSVASDFREIVERARNASANHPGDELGRQAADTEWSMRLTKGQHRFVDRILLQNAKNKDHQTLARQDLHAVLARVQVLDATGTTEQLRERGTQRLRPLVDNPTRALQTLERLAREAAIRRGVITRPDVETALSQDGAGLRHAALSFAIDERAYVEKIQHDSAAVDIAKLPSLEPHFRSSSEMPLLQHDLIKGKSVLVGGHGAGKSRIASELAVRSIRNGHRCLHIRLARWATTLSNLLVAELSLAAKRHARYADFKTFFGDAGLLVFDGLDEVPPAQRLNAEREIIEFADTYPHLDILVTCRPTSGRILSECWSRIQILPLNREQIDATLGQPIHTLHLSEPIVTLARNPLMLGLLVQQLANGLRPSTEANLLGAFIEQMVDRQSRRLPSIDSVSGHRLAEDAAFEWLSSDRIALNEGQLRSVTASVALSLKNNALVSIDACEVELWLEEAGLAVTLEAVIVPTHRAVLDHLAGLSIARRGAVQCAGHPELREAVARYLAAQTQVSDTMLSILGVVGKDLELLARGRRLTSDDIIWPFESSRFAEEYLAELRQLGTGPLVDVGVTDRPIEIDVDTDLSWITERDRIGPGDIVNIVPTPDRPYISDSDGSNRTEVLAFNSTGRHGATIDIRVPHFTAFARVKYELESLLRRRALPNEGPDIVYERLCSFATQFLRTTAQVGTSKYNNLSGSNFGGLTASALQAAFCGIVAELTGTERAPLDVSNTFIGFVPGLQQITVVEAPYTIDRGIGLPLGVHGGELTRLLTKATEFGIHEVPLHPLMLLPSSATDPILSLPGCQYLLHGDSLRLYIQRHEIGEIHSFHYLIEHNLRGLAPFLPQYSTMPWRVKIAIEEVAPQRTGGARTQSVRNLRADFDEVVVVSEVSTKEAVWTSSSNMSAYRGVLDGAYELVEQDLDDLMSGSNPLGSEML